MCSFNNIVGSGLSANTKYLLIIQKGNNKDFNISVSHIFQIGNSLETIVKSMLKTKRYNTKDYHYQDHCKALTIQRRGGKQNIENEKITPLYYTIKIYTSIVTVSIWSTFFTLLCSAESYYLAECALCTSLFEMRTKREIH